MLNELELSSVYDIISYLKKNDTEENRSMLLTTDELRYRYCGEIRDCPEVWPKITESKWAYLYCRNVKDRPDVWAKITESEWAYRYCQFVEDRPEVRKYVK